MVHALNTIAVLATGLAKVREALPSEKHDKLDKAKPDKPIELVPLDSGDAGSIEDENKIFLKREEYDAVVKKVANDLEKDKDYFAEPIEQFPEPKNYSQSVHNALTNVSNILSRAFERRTGMMSWVLLLVLKSYGFSKDDFKPIQELLKDASFIQNFTEYYSKVKSESKSEADKFLKDVFADDKKKQRLAKLALLITRSCDTLNNSFIERFPVIFSVQNLAMPILARIFKEGALGRFFDLMRLINPWLSEFLAEPVGIFKAEIQGVKKNLPQVQKTEEEKQAVSRNGESVDSITISRLNKQDYKLQKIVEHVNAAFERLLGRKNNIGALIIHGLLKHYKFEGYKAFASDIISKSSFIENLRNHLKDVKKATEEGTNTFRSEYDSIRQKFQEGKEALVGGIASGIISIAKAMPQWFLDKAPRVLGLPYSFQYLFMPILTKIVKEDSLLGKILHFLRDINPWINDLLLDPTATFQEEIRNIRTESEAIPELIPERKLPKPLKVVFERIRSFFEAIKLLKPQAA